MDDDDDDDDYYYYYYYYFVIIHSVFHHQSSPQIPTISPSRCRPFFPIRHQESRLLRAIFRLHPSLKDVKVYEGLVDDPEVTIEGRNQRWMHRDVLSVGCCTWCMVRKTCVEHDKRLCVYNCV